MTFAATSEKMLLFVKRHAWLLALLAGYSALIIWISGQHEIWRDEMRALSLVKACHSPLDIFRFTPKEGHPGLWYLILYLGWHLFQTNVILKITAIATAVAAAAVFLWKSPFNLSQKALFLLGVFPLYEYSVMSRNYGISMLLLFVFCALYAERFKRLLGISITVFFLAQTNLHSLVIAICIFTSLLTEYGYRRYQGNALTANLKPAVYAFSIMLAGILLAAMQILPDKSSVITATTTSMSFASWFQAVGQVFLHPGRQFIMAFGIPNALVLSILIWVLFLYFLRKPFVLIILMGGIVGIGLIFAQIYFGSLRHQGFGYLLVIAAFWMERREKRRIPALAYAPVQALKQGLLYLLLIMQVAIGYTTVRRDLQQPFSASAAVARFIQQRPEYRDAILIGEPDYYLESLPYYLDNPLYFPREQRFGKTVNFTIANREKMSLPELLATGRKLKREYGKPVLIELGHSVSAEAKHFRFWFSYHKYFEYDPLTLENFYQGTVKLGEFRQAISDERYALYEVK